jgi:class 3 adenylate cyclase/tetratricopeptide (TPR) repeat protein
VICPTCGAEAPDAARFCPSCGRPILLGSDERRVVTVVFADLVGFTGLSESRDPEQVKNLVDGCFALLADDVTAFGGRVDKVVGDALVALFGAPVAHEDDAERAVRSALQMQRTLATHAAQTGVDVQMRVGVNTGEVLVGALRAGGDYTAMGDVVNVASRLQTLARPGQVVVGPQTHASTMASIGFEPLGAVEARGREEPVQAWVALQALAPPGRRPKRSSPLVGRDHELGMLRHAFDTAVARQRAQFVLLLGEAGVGKSRLAEELAATAQATHGARLLEGRCVPYGEANVWWPIAEALRQACAIDEDDDVATMRRKCKEEVRVAAGRNPEDPDVDRMADGLLYLMGVESVLRDLDPARALEVGRRALQTVLEGRAQQAPVVVVLSELHWADDQVLALVDDLLGRLANLPVMLVATARPDLEERWAHQPGHHNVVVLHVDPLDAAATAELLQAIFEGEPPPELRDALIARSGGNPFFLEELVSLLIEAGLLSGDPARRSELVPGDELPATLRGLVAARLDALDRRQRATLEDAAVVGRTGSVAVLEAMAASRGETEPEYVRLELVARDLLDAEGSGETWSFRSELVREVAYGTLTKADRARRHAALAVWLERRQEELGRDEDLEQLAHHAGMAARLVLELGPVEGVPASIRATALHAIEKAAGRAKARDHRATALHLYEHALLLLPPNDGFNRRRALLGRAESLTALRRLEDARDDIDLVMAEAIEAGDRCHEAMALTILGNVEQSESNLSGSEEHLTQAVELFEAEDDRLGAAGARRLLGMTRLFAGDPNGARAAAAEALEGFRVGGDRRGQAWALQSLAWIAFTEGDTGTSEDYSLKSANLFNEIGDLGGVGWALGLLAWVRYFQGNLAEAGQLADQLIGESREMGDRWALAMILTLQASVRLWLGRPDEAIEPAMEAQRLFSDLNDSLGLHQSGNPLARALIAGGRVDEARQLVARITSTTIPASTSRMNALLPAAIALQLGEPQEALDALQLDDLSGSVSSMAGLLGDVESAAYRALALLQLGQADDAVVVLEQHAPPAHTDGEQAHYLSVLTLARAASGRTDGALEAAVTFDALKTGSYQDRIRVGLGRAFAFHHAGNEAEMAAAFAQAAVEADATTDRLYQGLVRLARARALEADNHPAAAEALDEARSRLAELGVPAPGWEVAFANAVGASVLPTA